MYTLMNYGEANGVPFTQYCKDMAVFFSRFKLTDRSNQYVKLVDMLSTKLLGGEVTLATINYDCLIEHASHLVFDQDLIGYFPGGRPIRLLKIHGSCNFGIKHPHLFIGGPVNVCGGSMIGFEPNQYDINYLEERINADKFQPVMSAYVRGKDTHVGTDLVKALRDEYRSKVLNADTVAIIGVRPNEYDLHIWNPIHETRARVVMIDPGSWAEGWFNTNLASKKNTFYKSDFGGCLNILRSELSV